ncbi:MAG: beta-ketoacyl-[acyl-carrier-protein] synthase family protein [Limisphaerales bacterium]
MNSTVLGGLLRQTPLAVTGYGAVSAAGDSPAKLWQAAAAGVSPAKWRDFPIGGGSRAVAVCAAEGSDSGDPALHPVRRMDRSAQLGWIAAGQALDMAGLKENPDGLEIGVIAGTSRGPVSRLAEGFARVGARRHPPSLAADCTLASLTGVLAQGFRLTGVGATVSATCASAAAAIALAAEQLLLGKADAMLAGGAEAPLTPLVIAQLGAAGLLGSHAEAARTCRPFDSTRNGLCLGEGAAFLVLETAAAAARRGAVLHGLLAGWAGGVANAGRTGVRDAGRGLAGGARRALTRAGLTPDAVDYVNAHGTGTRLNDAAEAQAMREIFGERAAVLPCSSTKPVTGHCLGATPALEAVIALEALRHQVIPPTANCLHPDPDCPINPQPLQARPARLTHVMSNSLGFWGYHVSLIFARPSA